MKRLLIALDYSESAEVVASKGFELAATMNAEVTLLHVLSDITYYSSLNYSPITGFDTFSTMDIVQNNSREELEDAAEKFLEFFKEKYSGNTPIDTEIGEGDFADEILKKAKDCNADIIVLGTHGRKGIEKIFMGSVAEKVLHKSVIPVYIIPIKKS